MPTYCYLCKECGYKFEMMQSITAPTKKKCPECKKLKLQRLIGSGSGVIFKGSGFYQTDYVNKPKKAIKPIPTNKQWKKGPAKKQNE